MPAKSAKPAGSAKPTASAKPTRSSVRKRTTAPRSAARKGKPGHGEIAERAYFIHLDEGGSDELANWLRAERELRAA